MSSILVPARPRRRSRRRPRVRRRRFALVILLALGGVVVALALGPLENAIREVTLPLRHEDIIRQQARTKHVDAALIAAVIYEESKFRDQTSHAGARGLMQITPRTAAFIARRSGGYRFTQRDLATAEGNEAKARSTYAKALTQFRQATATILDQYHIQMADAREGQIRKAPNIPGAPEEAKPGQASASNP